MNQQTCPRRFPRDHIRAFVACCRVDWLRLRALSPNGRKKGGKAQTRGPPLNRPGPPRTSSCTANQPRRPILKPLRGGEGNRETEEGGKETEKPKRDEGKETEKPKGPRGLLKGPPGPLNGPRGPVTGARGPLKGPRGPFNRPERGARLRRSWGKVRPENAEKPRN